MYANPSHRDLFGTSPYASDEAGPKRQKRNGNFGSLGVRVVYTNQSAVRYNCPLAPRLNFKAVTYRLVESHLIFKSHARFSKWR